MSEGVKWKDMRRLTQNVLRDFGMANSTICNYISLEVNQLLNSLKVRYLLFSINLICR